jgi:hypothetical protein
MSASEPLNSLIKDIMSRLNKQCPTQNNTNTNGSGSQNNSLTPQQLIVIAGILAGELDVLSVLVANDQHVEIVLSGSLKKKTQLDKILDQIGSLPFDEVVKAIIGRLRF